jgi:hypothetical protein
VYGAKFAGEARNGLSMVLWTLIFLGLGWPISVIAGRIADAINEARRVKAGSIDGQLVRTLLRLGKLAVPVALILFAADFCSVPFTPVIAGLGADSLDVELFAYIRTPDWLEYRAVREDINFRIIDIVNESGTGFAFPSQTTHLGRDSGLDAERAGKAEAAVAEWRSRGHRPLPPCAGINSDQCWCPKLK